MTEKQFVVSLLWQMKESLNAPAFTNFRVQINDACSNQKGIWQSFQSKIIITTCILFFCNSAVGTM